MISDPVINLDTDVRYSVNQVPPAKASSQAAEPKGYVPLIGSEVDVREEFSQQQVWSLALRVFTFSYHFYSIKVVQK